jgi:UDP-3-O-[3-hydroxymyristoyl] glucosamine N-acyltransferase
MQFQQAHTLAQLAQYLNGSCESAKELTLQGVATLKDATPSDISFLTQPQYVPLLPTTKASAIVVSAQYADKCTIPCIIVRDAHIAFAQLMQLCVPKDTATPGIHKNATVASSASVASTAFIDANAVIAEGASIGEYAHIGPGVSIGARTKIGDHTHLFANVNIYHDVQIGKRCIIHSGAVIGADGFGFANDKGTWIKIPQLAGVEIGDDVEIGANTAIDRGVLSPTRIGQGVKMDNLVQIGHNVQIGDHTIITGCVAIAGSTVIGKYCAIGGGSCINGHIHIADQVQITAMSGVLSSIEKPGIYSGIPVVENAQWRKNIVSYFRLPDILKRLRALEKRGE